MNDERLWAVTGVTIVDVETGELRSDETIVVRHGVIEAVGPAESATLPAGTLVVDEHGRYAIPGLWDMHVHIRGGPALEAANERWLRQYLAFGVTSVRDAAGDLSDAVLRWKAAIARGEIYGPRIFTALRKIDGPDGVWLGSIPVSSREEAAKALDALRSEGADFVKVYDGSIAPDVYIDVLEEAERRGLRTAAHVPLSVPFVDAIEAGLDSVEHAFHLVKAANPSDRAASRAFARDGIPEDFEPFFVAVSALGEAADERTARKVFREMAQRGTALTPTLYIRRAWNRLGEDGLGEDGLGEDGLGEDSFVDGGLGEDARGGNGRRGLSSLAEDNPRLEAVPPEIRKTYGPALDIFLARTDEERASDLRLEKISLRLTRLAAEEGVTILAGTDTGADNPLAYPGDSLHRELETLVDAGLTPLQALRAATLEPARWFGKADELGTIAKGKLADFVILEANPLEDISRTRSIAAVVQQGVFFDRRERDDLAALQEERRP
ncbi:MAG TPA: amidohydrolase family protein [Gammaproteobacteria bacterium]|nr:amidohydrolase family protein [Gammaproteobacteria bacterium]